VKGSGDAEIRMAPGPDGRVWVSIPAKDGVVVALLDGTGAPSPGWPVRLPGVDGCDKLLPVSDATLRIICSVPPPSSRPDDSVARAFSFDANAVPTAGWPVDIADGANGALDGDDLVLLFDPLLQIGGEAGQQWPVAVVTIRPDGTQRKGVEVPFECCDTDLVLGPRGVAYGITRQWTPAASDQKAQVLAFGPDGPIPGWPITINGITSDLAFDAQGHAYAAVATPDGGTTRTVVLDATGHLLPASSVGQPVVSTTTWDGAGDGFPGPPIVASDGTTFILETDPNKTVAVGLDPTGKPLPGWPYRSKSTAQWIGGCGEGDTGCGRTRTDPGIGQDNALYLLNEASGSSTGGSVVAIGADGVVRDGWPVGLRRAGATFSSVVIAPYGLAWALVTEPEKKGSSATILAIADDSTVLWTTTVVEP
jgi:hypothetical protein